MARIILFNKPYLVLSQFTDSDRRDTLAQYLHGNQCRGYYPAGRLDRDSEGLLLLTDDGDIQARISHPKYKLPKTYWVQVEGQVDRDTLNSLAQGVQLKDGLTAPAKVESIAPPQYLWERHPPIRSRPSQPTSWLSLTITEGRNRQVRRMTAAVGLPTLRLIRAQIGPWQLGQLSPGEYRWEACNLPRLPRKLLSSRAKLKHRSRQK